MITLTKFLEDFIYGLQDFKFVAADPLKYIVASSYHFMQDEMNEVIGTVAGSYAEHRCAPSTVENISNGGFVSKNQADSTIADLDSILYVDECDISILKTTAV